MVSGLDNVIAADTVLSHVDGEAGRLIIRGFDLEDLAGHTTFEDATSTLWSGVVATPLSPDLARALGRARQKAYSLFQPLTHNLAGLSAVEAMRLLLS